MQTDVVEADAASTAPSGTIFKDADAIVEIIEQEVAHALQTVEITAVSELSRVSALLSQSGYTIHIGDDNQAQLVFAGEAGAAVARYNETAKQAGRPTLLATNIPRMMLNSLRLLSEANDALRVEKEKVAAQQQSLEDARGWKARYDALETTLKNTRDATDMEAQDSRQKTTQLEEQLEANATQLKTLTDSLSQWGAVGLHFGATTPAELSGGISNAMRELASLKEKLATAESELASANQRISTFDDQAQARAVESAAWVAERQQLQDQHASAMKVAEDMRTAGQRELEQLRGSAKTLQGQIDKITAERDGLQAAKADLEEKIDSEAMERELEKDMSKEEREKLASQVLAAEGRQTELERKLHAAEEREADLKQALQSAETREADLQQQQRASTSDKPKSNKKKDELPSGMFLKAPKPTTPVATPRVVKIPRNPATSTDSPLSAKAAGKQPQTQPASRAMGIQGGVTVRRPVAGPSKDRDVEMLDAAPSITRRTKVSDDPRAKPTSSTTTSPGRTAAKRGAPSPLSSGRGKAPRWTKEPTTISAPRSKARGSAP
uniref:Uncharacterized protein n=1 Tax=Mycena chlorophos TaxID=658473 RepID=A0ABQ0LVR5_MYCCL|nr:predicted protein [Mycena chlorophos]